jgi:plastocyanin
MRFPVLEQRRVSAGTVLLAATVMVAIPSFGAARAENTTVTIHNFAFTPPQLTLAAGTTVTWRNDDDIPHTVNSSTGTFKSKALDTGDTFAFTFTAPGSYEYFCSLHPRMTGMIEVKPGNATK